MNFNFSNGLISWASSFTREKGLVNFTSYSFRPGPSFLVKGLARETSNGWLMMAHHAKVDGYTLF